MSVRSYIVTVEDAIDAGLRLGLSRSRTLELWREGGGRIRTEDFVALWNERKQRLGARRLGA